MNNIFFANEKSAAMEVVKWKRPKIGKEEFQNSTFYFINDFMRDIYNQAFEGYHVETPILHKISCKNKTMNDEKNKNPRNSPASQNQLIIRRRKTQS